MTCEKTELKSSPWKYSTMHSNAGTRWGQVVTSCCGHFTAKDTAPVAHLTRSRVGIGAGLDTLDKRKIPYPSENQTGIPQLSSHSLLSD